MNMQHYRDVSARVTPRADLKEEVITMAETMQNKKRRPVMRKIGIVLAAAAVAVGGMTVAVGAANGWDYPALFNRYFSIREGAENSADLSKHTHDIDRTWQGEGYTVTVQSVIADSAAVCVLYEVQFDAEMQEMLAKYDGSEIEIYGCLDGEVQTDREVLKGDVLTFGPSDAVLHEDKEAGVWRGVFVCNLFFENTDDAVLVIKPSDLSLHTGMKHTIYPISGCGIRVPLAELNRETEIVRDCDITLADDLSQVRYTHLELGAMHMILSDEGTQTEAVKEASRFVPDPFYTNVTLIYADGTEKTAEARTFGRAGASAVNDECKEYHYHAEWCCGFRAPIETANLTAVIINGTEIPLK